MTIDSILCFVGIPRSDIAYYYISYMLDRLLCTGKFEYESAAKKFRVTENQFRKAIANTVANAHAQGNLKIINHLLQNEGCINGIIVTPTEFLHFLQICISNKKCSYL